MDRRASSAVHAAAGEHSPRDASVGGDGDASLTKDAPVEAFLETLRDTGVLRDRPIALLPPVSPDAEARLAAIRVYLLDAAEADPAAHARRTAEIAYLANVLVAGCAFRSRRFTKAEAAEAVLATCNLGLENRPPRLPYAGTSARATAAKMSVLDTTPTGRLSASITAPPPVASTMSRRSVSSAITCFSRLRKPASPSFSKM